MTSVNVIIPTMGVLLLSLHFITIVFNNFFNIGFHSPKSDQSKIKVQEKYLFLKKQSKIMVFICMKNPK